MALEEADFAFGCAFFAMVNGEGAVVPSEVVMTFNQASVRC